MANSGNKAKRALVACYLIILHGALVWLLVEKFVAPRLGVLPIEQDVVQGPVSGPQVTPAVIPPDSTTPEPLPVPTASPATEFSVPSAPVGTLLIPVQGVTAEQLRDTYSDARSEGRSHDAIDILAPGGTPVLASADGEIVKFFNSKAGGTTIYQISTDRKYFFYYAHLQKRADDISEKQFVPRGKVIGYVGDTGNAGPGNYHLHFAITLVRDPSRYWEGTPINPFPLLQGQKINN